MSLPHCPFFFRDRFTLERQSCLIILPVAAALATLGRHLPRQVHSHSVRDDRIRLILLGENMNNLADKSDYV